MLKVLEIGGARAVARCDALTSAPFSDMEDGLFRPYLGAAHAATSAQIKAWMVEAGMQVRFDPAGNLVGRFGPRSAKALLIASHIDSVHDAGAYDGPLGVMLAIEVVAALNARREALPFAIEVYAFGDEEGSRFPASMLCSRAVCGQLGSDALDVSDSDGLPLATALETFRLSRDNFLNARRDSEEFIGYLEAHIEQGPVLDAENIPLGIVTSIAGQRRYEVSVAGAAGHAGTNSMALRKDAFTAAAEMALAVETVGLAGSEDLVATVGRLTVAPNAPNVVPGSVVFSIDVRAGVDETRDLAVRDILQRIEDIAVRRGVSLAVNLVHDLPAAPCDPQMMALLEQAFVQHGQPVKHIVSGAGHDAMAFATVTPTAMIFIRCKDGVSHNPLESVAVADVELAFQTMLAFVENLEGSIDG